MIKLNNKNITYVALADSNNSLKAPKEIWYADSSNSVKLVYRRKDALIEGEDYEKYHWLDGDGSAYIDTLVKNLTNVHYIDLFISVDGVSSGHNIFFGRESVVPYYNSQVVLYYVSNRQSIVVWADSVGQEINFADIVGNVTLNFDTNIASTPTDSVDFSISNYNSAFSVFLFTRNNNGNAASPFIGKIKKLEIDNILHLIPCKLLKPVPKWLDANGIRRQVGECGMIDLISGKFYGNVNSVGTFTVENYYERKEWLRVQTTTQIGCYLRLPLDTMNFSFKRVWLSNFLNTWYFGTPGYVYYTDNHRLITIWDSANAVTVNSGDTSTINVGDTITIESTPDLLLMNGKTINRYNYVSGAVSLTNAVALEITSLTSSVTVDEAERYIPCILTMDLPASMDANNIARTKGTSGMWDLVSDKFYGNVANSGTFKAVNLAEGVDYEVHQWLKGDSVAYIQGVTYDLWNNHLQMQIGTAVAFSRSILYEDRSSGAVLTAIRNRDAAYPESYMMIVFREGTSTSHIADISYNDIPQILDLDFYIDNAIFQCIRNGVVFTTGEAATESLWTSITPIIPSNKVSYIRELLPNNTYRSNLVPCKLLHSIPSTYDANGIARQAGECGMYDTVNDVFYGNVASSGSFTVSDDE